MAFQQAYPPPPNTLTSSTTCTIQAIHNPPHPFPCLPKPYTHSNIILHTHPHLQWPLSNSSSTQGSKAETSADSDSQNEPRLALHAHHRPTHSTQHKSNPAASPKPHWTLSIPKPGSHHNTDLSVFLAPQTEFQTSTHRKKSSGTCSR